MEEKIVKVKIGKVGNTVKVVSESEARKWVDNQQKVISDLVSRGASREEAEKYFQATIVP